MIPEDFFEKQTNQSKVKARIVQKYFSVWANVIMPTAEKHGECIAYIDLYAGPGRYEDGALSTPLLVLQKAIANPKISQMLVTFFNDADSGATSTLESAINELPGIKSLRYKPKIFCGEIDKDAENYFKEIRLVPSVSFLDPCGYKGLSLNIINAMIKDWGCDCIFFFNYNRINAGLSNPMFADHMNALFGKNRADNLRNQLSKLNSVQRETLILKNLTEALKEKGGKFVLSFCFKDTNRDRTSHNLVFVSKNFKGYEIMKNIMAAESSTKGQDVSSLTYSPADASTPQLSLFNPLDDLEKDLLKKFAGQELTRDKIYEQHSVDTPYIKKNYNKVLKSLEDEEMITVKFPKKNRRKGTYPSPMLICFPKEDAHG